MATIRDLETMRERCDGQPEPIDTLPIIKAQDWLANAGHYHERAVQMLYSVLAELAKLPPPSGAETIRELQALRDAVEMAWADDAEDALEELFVSVEEANAEIEPQHDCPEEG